MTTFRYAIMFYPYHKSIKTNLISLRFYQEERVHWAVFITLVQIVLSKQLIIIYRRVKFVHLHWGCPLIYRTLSYPLGSLDFPFFELNKNCFSLISHVPTFNAQLTYVWKIHFYSQLYTKTTPRLKQGSLKRFREGSEK